MQCYWRESQYVSTVKNKHASTLGEGKLLYFAVMIDNYKKNADARPGPKMLLIWPPVTSATLARPSTNGASVTPGPNSHRHWTGISLTSH